MQPGATDNSLGTTQDTQAATVAAKRDKRGTHFAFGRLLEDESRSGEAAVSADERDGIMVLSGPKVRIQFKTL